MCPELLFFFPFFQCCYTGDFFLEGRYEVHRFPCSASISCPIKTFIALNVLHNLYLLGWKLILRRFKHFILNSAESFLLGGKYFLKENDLFYQKVCFFFPFDFSIFRSIKWMVEKRKMIFAYTSLWLFFDIFPIVMHRLKKNDLLWICSAREGTDCLQSFSFSLIFRALKWSAQKAYIIFTISSNSLVNFLDLTTCNIREIQNDQRAKHIFW